MIVKEALLYACERLKPITEVAGLEAQWLLEWVLKENKMYIMINENKTLTDAEQIQFEEAVLRRSLNEPMQYIIGTQEFMGLEFAVTPEVLIPRGDTECLVELIIEQYQSAAETLEVLDLGSGSGAIGVSVAYHLKQAHVTCVDLSEGAVAMTRQNATTLLTADCTKRFQAVHADMFDYLDALPSSSQDLILSNPPYIPSADIETLQTEVRCHEPRTALDGGIDGLDYYRRLVKEAKDKLKSSAWMLFEVGHDQAELVKQLFLDDGGYEGVECYRDLQGVLRMVGAHKK